MDLFFGGINSSSNHTNKFFIFLFKSTTSILLLLLFSKMQTENSCILGEQSVLKPKISKYKFSIFLRRKEHKFASDETKMCAPFGERVQNFRKIIRKIGMIFIIIFQICQVNIFYFRKVRAGADEK